MSTEEVHISVSEREGEELFEPAKEMMQIVTIYQKMVLMDDGEEVEGDRTIESDLSGPEVTKFLEMWDKLWHPKVSDEQVQNMINGSLANKSGQQQEDVNLDDANRDEVQSSSGQPIEIEGLRVSAVSKDSDIKKNTKY